MLGVVSSSLLAQQKVPPDPEDLQVIVRSATIPTTFAWARSSRSKLTWLVHPETAIIRPCALFREGNFGYPLCLFLSHWSLAISPGNGWLDSTKEFGGPGAAGAAEALRFRP